MSSSRPGENLPRLRDERRFNAWLNAILANRCRDLLRRRGRIKEIDLEGAGLGAADPAPRIALERAAVLAAFDRLSFADRQKSLPSTTSKSAPWTRSRGPSASPSAPRSRGSMPPERRSDERWRSGMTTIDPNVVDAHLARGLRERAADLGDEDRFYLQVLATIAIRPQRRWFGRRPPDSAAGLLSCSSPRPWSACSPGPPWSGRSSVSSRRGRSCLQSGPPLGG